MGIVFGKIDVETPDHKVVFQGEGFEVWRYPPSVAAVVHANDLNPENPPTGKQFSTEAFRTLARYIGVFNTPENASRVADTTSENIAMTAPVVMAAAESEKIAMTAPVVMSAVEPEKIAMTGPVLMGDMAASTGESMAFLLPSKYKSVDDAPVPSNAAVKIEMKPERYEAVLSFSGFLPNESAMAAQARADELLALMKKADIEPTGSYSLAGYNPPFTLPWLRRNEIHIPVDGAKFEE